jgi:hypothetical protein
MKVGITTIEEAAMPGRYIAAAAAFLALPALPAAAQSLSFSDMRGLAIEASWIERFKWRYVGQEKLTETPSPRTLKMTIGSNGNIDHSITRMAGGSTLTTDGEGPLGKVTTRGKFTHRWSFEDGRLIYTETLIEGARRLVISVSRIGDAWSCSLSAALAREQGKGKIISIHLATGKPTEMTDISVQKGECRIGKS